MRALLISGLVLVVIGLWILIRPPSYSHNETVVKLGDIEAKMQQQHTVPGWVGGLALGAGAVLIVFGLRKS
jgi:hypothetical protein